MSDIRPIPMKMIEGDPVALGDPAGSVLLAVNVTSKSSSSDWEA